MEDGNQPPIGVVGLTTAVRIQEKGGYQVAIVAEALPSDPKSIKYTSHWAVSGFVVGYLYSSTSY
jgi:2-polyprenyl-6-methoxyphenol hydroxylase-like FAD-dependent oxidoreductase